VKSIIGDEIPTKEEKKMIKEFVLGAKEMLGGTRGKNGTHCYQPMR